QEVIQVDMFWASVSRWFKDLLDRLGLTVGQAIAIALFVGYLASLSGKIDALGRNLVEYRAETQVEIAKLDKKIDIAVLEIYRRIDLLEAKFETELAKLRGDFNTELAKLKGDLNAKIDDVKSSLNAKIDDVKSSLNTKIDDVKNSLNAKIDDVKGDLNDRVDELKMNDLAHVAQGISEIAFLLVKRGVLSQDEAEHVKDIVHVTQGAQGAQGAQGK
ncbi:MAG: apolipoprotein A1/A4/E family protein, partial [Synergistaceae bacterium]|nr:apolipoprotein A1/A4/E family protein [Synergistaceae bacterium]